MSDLTDLQGYIAELERKVEALEQRATRTERRLDATISIATRNVLDAVLRRLANLAKAE
jgi:hypothetical protein